MVAINPKFETAMTARLYEPGVMDLITGRTKLPDVAKGVGTSILRKTKSRIARGVRSRLGKFGGAAFDYASNRAKYFYVRNFVRNVLDGKPAGRRVYEVRYGTLPGRDIARFEGRDIYVPLVSEIPNVYGERYSTALNKSGLGPDRFNKTQRDYILMHELVDSWCTEKYGEIDPRDGKRKLDPEQHGEMEALMHKALQEFEANGYRKAGDVYKAGHIMHSARSDNDPFKNLTRKYLLAA